MPMRSRHKPKSSHSGEFTAEFHHEFEAETREMLRTRFLWFDGLVGGMWLLMLGFGVFRLVNTGALNINMPGVHVDLGGAVSATRFEFAKSVAPSLFQLVAVAVYCASFLAVRRGRFADRDLLRLTFALVMVDGVLRVVMSVLKIDGGAGLTGVMFAHMLACAFLPWSPKQSLGPIVPLLALNFVLKAMYGSDDVGDRVLGAAFGSFVAVPGLFISWMKYSRRVEGYKTRFLQRRYGELRRELVDARRIHEALFPSPRTTGPIRFTYRYEPMRQIGGDYLYACFGSSVESRARADSGTRPNETLNMVVLDVTGHGIPAALTVNRLHGELERVFAENPDVGPGEVLRLLNKYVHLTLANHSVYMTALCFKFDCGAGTLTYASGGHPPAFLRAVDGTIHELQSTAFVLGACADADFDAAPVTMRFGPGDALIAYTDGAIEARDKHGRMLGVNGFMKLVSSLPGNVWATSESPSGNAPSAKTDGVTLTQPAASVWSEMLLRAVETHRDGPPADDTLVIEVSRGAS